MTTYNEMKAEKWGHVHRKMYLYTQEDEDLGTSGNSLCHKIIIKTDFIAQPKFMWQLPFKK